MMWLSFLHFYQPANTESYNIHKALDKSYWRLLRLMDEHPSLKMSWNVSGCLLDRLEDEKENAWIDRLKFLVKKGRVELVGSAAYHGFLPLLPETEIISQIKTNEKILRRHFGRGFKPTGFFLPEMAYSPLVAKVIKKLGYSWLILDEISYNRDLHRHPENGRVYQDEASGLKVVFRERALSSTYPPDSLLSILKKDKLSRDVHLTATDAELYGLRHEDPTAELEKLAKVPELKTSTISAWIKRQKAKPEKIKIWASTWESSPADLRANRPYFLWQQPRNKIQADLWRLANLALSLGDKFPKDKNKYWYRWHLVRGLASCTFWWASAHDFSKVFGPYAWSPDDVERGLEDMIRSVRSLEDVRSKKYKLEAEKYYLRIKKLLWQEHWRKHWQKNI